MQYFITENKNVIPSSVRRTLTSLPASRIPLLHHGLGADWIGSFLWFSHPAAGLPYVIPSGPLSPLDPSYGHHWAIVGRRRHKSSILLTENVVWNQSHIYHIIWLFKWFSFYFLFCKCWPFPPLYHREESTNTAPSCSLWHLLLILNSGCCWLFHKQLYLVCTHVRN